MLDENGTAPFRCFALGENGDDIEVDCNGLDDLIDDEHDELRAQGYRDVDFDDELRYDRN